MKQITKISIILFAILFTCCEASCTNKVPKSKKKIKKVAYMYLDAMANYRIDNAVPFCTKETREGVIETGRALLQSVDTNYIKSDTPAKITIGDIDLTSDTTAIAHFHKSTPLKEHNGQVDLVKRNGKWKVHIVLNKHKNEYNDLPKQKQEKPEIIQGEINGREILAFPAKQKK